MSSKHGNRKGVQKILRAVEHKGRKRLFLYFLVTFALIESPQVLFAQSQAPMIPSASQGETQEVYLSFDYNGLTNSVITAYYYRDSVYIPIGVLFNQLKLNCVIDARDSVVKGFFIDQSTPYEINFSTDVAKIGDKEIHFDRTQAIIKPLDFYLLPSLFAKIFDLNFSVDFSSLSLILTTNVELPIIKEYERETRRNYSLVSPQSQLIQAPLQYPRKRSLLNGGVLDYSLTAYRGNNQNSYEYSLTGGAEILGGETEGAVMGNITPINSQIYSSNISWKYVFDSTRYISYASLGNLYTDGLTQFGYRGGQVSNEPVALRTLFSSYPIEAKTKPNWEVELYLNGELVDFATADSNGNAYFNIPIVYGTSFVQMKFYGPSGEFEEQDRRLQIPFTFVPSGEINYTVSGGKLNNTDYNLASTNVVFGISDWLTDKVGVDYVDDPSFSKPLFYNSAYVRMGPEYTLSVDLAPMAFYRSTFNALYPSQASFDLAYSRYEHNLLYNPSDELQQAEADVFVPFTILNTSINFRAAGTSQQYENGERANSYSAYVSSNVAQVNASVGYLNSLINYGSGSTIRTYGWTASLLYSMFFGQGFFSFLNGTLANLTTRYGVLKNSLDDIRFELSKNIQQYIRVEVSVERDYVNRLTSFNLQIIADLPFTRSTTTAQSQGRTSFYTENLSGAVGFDANYSRFLFNDLPWVGHSAASMRLYVDNNGDGKFDNGDEVIKEGIVTLRQGVSSQTYSNGIIRDWNLLPYTQYSADIDVSSIKNPLWIPEEKSFSFVSDPNSYKKIDIPFFASGIVDGTVLKFEGGIATAIPGLSLEIKSVGSSFEKTVNVFEDGSFYYMGLPPGEYTIKVDSSQLSILDLESDPPVLTFNVEPTKQGDYVEGLKILLKDKKKTNTGELIEAPLPETSSEPIIQTHPPESSSPITSALSTGRYVVQVGAFTTRETAERVASNSMRNIGQRLCVSLNRDCNLYVVQTDTFENRHDVLNELDLLFNWFDFGDAFIINADGKRPSYLYAVQLAAFRTLHAASQFAHGVRKEIGFLPIIRYKKSLKIFSVLAGSLNTVDEAKELSDSLRRSGICDRPIVTIYGPTEIQPTFTVQLGTFTTATIADRFVREFRKQTGMIALIDFDSKEMKFKALTPTLPTIAEAEVVLDSIRTYRDYQRAQIVSLP